MTCIENNHDDADWDVSMLSLEIVEDEFVGNPSDPCAAPEPDCPFTLPLPRCEAPRNPPPRNRLSTSRDGELDSGGEEPFSSVFVVTLFPLSGLSAWRFQSPVGFPESHSLL